MIRATIMVLQDVEEELGADVNSVSDLKAMGDKVDERLHVVADALDKLEKLGWKWDSAGKEIHVFKDSPREDAEKELLEAGMPKEIVHFD